MDDSNVPLKPFVAPTGPKRLAGVDHNKLAKSARDKLLHLSFDPMAELVGQYEALTAEINRMAYIRDNMHDTSKVPEHVSKKYSARLHLETYNQLTAITKELLRFGYARVSESNELITNVPPMMQIQLTKKGDVFEIGVPSGAQPNTPSEIPRLGDDW